MSWFMTFTESYKWFLFICLVESEFSLKTRKCYLNLKYIALPIWEMHALHMALGTQHTNISFLFPLQVKTKISKSKKNISDLYFKCRILSGLTFTFPKNASGDNPTFRKNDLYDIQFLMLMRGRTSKFSTAWKWNLYYIF